VIYGDGEQTRDFTYAANAVLATMQAGGTETRLAGEVVNVGTGQRVSILDLARRLGDLNGRADLAPEHREARAGDVRHSLADISRARDLLGYKAFASLEDGLRETAEWCAAQRGASRPADR
jgi:nucleoside-diphosphate-sugar epimerase